MKSECDIVKLQKEYVLPTYAPELLFVKGEGSYLWDQHGKKYLDFTSGIGVCGIGHSNPDVAKAVSNQLHTLLHVSNLYMNENQPQLAEKLIKHSFGKGAVFFANSGAEANEGMIKFARKYGSEKGRFEIIAMDDSFHGRTLATLAATGRSKYREGFKPDMPGFIHVPFNDIQAVESAITPKTCAILVEPVQGEGGVIPANTEYLKALRTLCDKNDILLMFDEVQCGMGRTGKFFAWQHYGVEPDLFSLAKALGNGFPIGAFVVKDKYRNVLEVGTHASTFGGTPLACSAAIAVIDYFDKNDVLENCTKQSVYCIAKLEKLKEKYSCIQNIRGMGLMLGVVLDRPAQKLRKLIEDMGILTLTAGENVLRLLPPLTVTEDEIDAVVSAIDHSIEVMLKQDI